MAKKIRKAVFPVAGLGTRILPASKSVPKEMLTVVDRPVIQHVVDEARAAGIEQFIFVTGRNKAIVEDHFDHSFELEATLEAKGRNSELAALRQALPAAGHVSFTRQQKPLGLGHAVWCARELVGDEPFALLLPDVITQCPGAGTLQQMLQAYESVGGNIIAAERVAPESAHLYGIIDAMPGVGRLRPLAGLVEKPPAGTAPSDLMIMGRYILQPEIFDLLGRCPAGAGGEIQLTDALRTLIAFQPAHALEYEGRSFDCGSKIGFLTANIALGLSDAALGREMGELLLELLPAQCPDLMRRLIGTMHWAPQGASRLVA